VAAAVKNNPQITQIGNKTVRLSDILFDQTSFLLRVFDWRGDVFFRAPEKVAPLQCGDLSPLFFLTATPGAKEGKALISQRAPNYQSLLR
jgi:hypothetical protein